MFTVPDKYIDNNHLELMLKELSFLFFQFYKYYPDKFSLAIGQKVFFISYEKKQKLIYFSISSEDFILNYSADGFVFKDCVCKLNSQHCTVESLLEFVSAHNLIFLLKEKIQNKKNSFILDMPERQADQN